MSESGGANIFVTEEALIPKKRGRKPKKENENANGMNVPTKI
jgi:hypothetical protein